MADEILKVRVNSPEKIIWEGTAVSISSENSQGVFDILPMHSNFLTVIDNKKIIVRTSNENKEFIFPHSVIYAHLNQVNIYTNI